MTVSGHCTIMDLSVTRDPAVYIGIEVLTAVSSWICM